jgi:hypothetical protein
MSAIRFETTLFKIGNWTILQVPKDASAKLPSRGQAMVVGRLNGIRFQTPLEPDGNWSHWFRVENALLKAAGITAGDKVTLEITPAEEWPEPDIPEDLRTALDANPEAYAVWAKATPMAHWEWMRWLRATKDSGTRARRIEVACSKLKKGERRPCCWNRNLCTEPSVSKNGVLLEPAAK